jgi:hypothetical protein
MAAQSLWRAPLTVQADRDADLLTAAARQIIV